MYTLAESLSLLRQRRISSVELTELCLANIARLNPQLNAFITVTADLALQQARAADDSFAKGNDLGPLHGIPVALKDLIDVAGVPTTAASRQLSGNVASRDAEIVTRLKQAGAVILGKTNLHEFAFGGSGMVSAYGPALNPWDATRSTGGSSSGSAAAVASGMCVAAVGTDTAGSVRTPAALCGIVGHRPSAGVCSSHGVIPLRRSFDTPGPVTRTVEDAILLLETLSGRNFASDAALKNVRVGVARTFFFDDLDREVTSALSHAEEALAALAKSVHPVTLNVEARWTDFDREILDYHQPLLDRSAELYQPGTLARLQSCVAISLAQYDSARKALAAARQQAERIFEGVDVVITPTCVVPAPRIADLQALSAADLRAYEVNYLLRNTAPFSLLFWPSVSVLCGFTDSGLPIGMQISARPGADALALAVARNYEAATAWHKRTPPLFA